MESKCVKVLDNSHRDIRRRRANRCAANIIDAAHKVLSLQPKRNSLLTRLGKRKRFVCNSKCGLHLRKSLLTNYSNLRKSGLPQRLLFYQNGEWKDYPWEIVELVRKDFQMKKAAIEVQFNGFHLMLDILYMMQVDMRTGSQKPIAWIDEAGSCFFPQLYSTNGGVCDSNHYELEKGEESMFVERNGTPEIKLHLQIEVNGVNGYNLEECVEESNLCSKRIKIEHKPSENDYELGVNDNYSRKSGAKREDVVDEVQQIGENLSLNSQDIFETSRWEIFQKQVEITQKYRVNPNVRYAWLASTKDALSSIMTYGLAHCGPKGQSPYGVGVHLTSLKCALTSAIYCDVDENDIRHMMFCRVILGNMEPVHPGSKQYHPSSDNFDSGVDDLQNPSHYTIWNMNMNTYIYPEYVVSFKMSHSAGEALGGKESRYDIPGFATCHGREVQLQLDLSSVETVTELGPFCLICYYKDQVGVLCVGTS